MRRRTPVVLTVLVVVGAIALASPLGGAAVAANSAEPEESVLSSYWHRRVRQWDSLIGQEAERRALHPDLLASLVWMESRGDSGAVGPVGAVGLTQVMPREAGFTWRPTHDELLDPSTNLFWGTRTLATVVKQGKGDIFNALAAYNGGWDQIMYRGPTIFATTILRDFARATAVRHGLDGSGWVAYYAVDYGEVAGPIWIADADRDDVYLFGERNVTPEGERLIPATAPTEAVATCAEGEERCAVGLWLNDKATGQWIGPADVAPPPPTPTPTAEPAERLPHPVMAVMAGSVGPGGWSMAAAPEPRQVAAAEPTPQPTPPAAPVPVDTSAPVSEPPAQIAATEAVTETPPVCGGGELALDAWPLDTIWTEEGWKVHIFAEGHGGDCSYSYAWNDDSDVRAVDTPDCVVFEVTSDRRDAAILGSVVVTSGGEVQRVGIYVSPPGS